MLSESVCSTICTTRSRHSLALRSLESAMSPVARIAARVSVAHVPNQQGSRVFSATYWAIRSSKRLIVIARRSSSLCSPRIGSLAESSFGVRREAVLTMSCNGSSSRPDKNHPRSGAAQSDSTIATKQYGRTNEALAAAAPSMPPLVSSEPAHLDQAAR